MPRSFFDSAAAPHRGPTLSVSTTLFGDMLDYWSYLCDVHPGKSHHQILDKCLHLTHACFQAHAQEHGPFFDTDRALNVPVLDALPFPHPDNRLTRPRAGQRALTIGTVLSGERARDFVQLSAAFDRRLNSQADRPAAAQTPVAAVLNDCIRLTSLAERLEEADVGFRVLAPESRRQISLYQQLGLGRYDPALPWAQPHRATPLSATQRRIDP